MKVLLFFFLLTNSARAATCCGGALAVPSLITTDDRGQFMASLAQGQVSDDVFDNGMWQRRTNPESVQTLKFEGAHLISDRWQVGGSVPILRRERDTEVSAYTSSGLGDISADLGYEYLPEWDYSLYRPKGVAFMQVTAPTGTSMYDSNDLRGLDIRGRGVWSLGVGTILSKTIYPFDLQLVPEIHHGLARTVGSTLGDQHLMPGWGGSVFAGGGWSRRALRVGGGIAWNYDDPIATAGVNNSSGALQRYATGIAQLSYMPNDEWSIAASYSDQTLFGAPQNTTLSQSILASLQKRWPR